MRFLYPKFPAAWWVAFEALYTYILNLTMSIGLQMNPAKHPAIPDKIKLSLNEGYNGLSKKAIYRNLVTF